MSLSTSLTDSHQASASLIDTGGRLAFRPHEAAKALGISARTLWQWTRDGKIPHVRMGKTILYPVAELRAWLAAQVAQQAVGTIAAEMQGKGNGSSRTDSESLGTTEL